jgi:acetoin utilization protein AcuB
MTTEQNGGMIVILIRDVMKRRLVTITPETTRADARRLLDEHGIRHLPVVAGGRLVGIVSDRDVPAERAGTPETVAGALMTRNPVTVTTDTRIEDAARLMLDRKFGALPVVDDGVLTGIVTYTDLLRAFVQVIETATEERIAIDFKAAA